MAGGYPVEPVDIHASIRHLDLPVRQADPDRQSSACLQPRQRTRRRCDGDGTHRCRFDPRRIRRITQDVHQHQLIIPPKTRFPMLDGAMRLARRGQPVIVTPFTLSGAMAPVTLVGAVMQQTAEALAAIALLEIVNPGDPGGVRLVYLKRGHEKRRPCIWHPGIHACHPTFRSDGALLQSTHAFVQRLRGQLSRLAVGMGKRLLLVGVCVSPEPMWCITPRVGWKGVCAPVTKNLSWTAKPCSR